jgi:hypothetical protein
VLAFFSIDRARGEELRQWLVDPANADDVDWDPGGGSVGLGFVRETARRFLPHGTDARIVGLAAAASDADALERCFGVENDAPCVPSWLRRRASPEPGGTILGYEPAPILREAPQRACSWVCEGFDGDQVEEALGLRPDESGLLSSHEEASRACAWLRGLGGLCGGERWFSWRLSAYALEA